MEDGIKERILIILPSILTNQDSSQGVKAKYLLELDAKLNKKGIKLTIATVKKTQPLINYLKEEKFKKYIISLINSEDNEDFVAVDKINIKLYKGVIIPSYISIYKEYLENQFGQILLEFHKQNKLILCLGHSTIVLASMKLQSKYFIIR